MARLLLIRPGATEYDQQGRIQGTLDIPLCEDGRRQVERLADTLDATPPVAIYNSPCQAAQQTAARLAAGLGLKPKTLEKLKNLDYGLWQGMLVEDVKTKQPKVYRQWRERPETICPPQGETVQAVKQRVADAVKKILKRRPGDVTIAVVAPEPVASVLRHVVLEERLGDFWNTTGGCGEYEWIETQLPAPVG